MAKIIVFLDHMEICFSEVRAGLAFTSFLEWGEVLSVGFASEFDLAVGSECCPESCSSCWEDAVEHIDSKCYA